MKKSILFFCLLFLGSYGYAQTTVTIPPSGCTTCQPDANVLTVGTNIDATLTECDATIGGTYDVGVALDGTHFIDVDVNVGSVGSYDITTNTVNGYSFSGAGTFAGTGTQTIRLQASGTPTFGGTDGFAITISGTTCAVPVSVDGGAGSIDPLDCTTTLVAPKTYNPDGTAYTGGTITINYTGGDGGSYPAQTINSTGVTGFTATLDAGTLNVGAGSITLNVSGNSTINGSVDFSITFLGETCTASIYGCGAFVSATEWKAFMCHNLGADESLDPHTPIVQGLHGNYYQWGRSAVVATASSTNGAIGGWITTPAGNGSWSDAIKQGNDPCPAGFRVPTKDNWVGVEANNFVSKIGSWTGSPSNFGSAVRWGPDASTLTLTLPAAGYRNHLDGSLQFRDQYGAYWSSTELGPNTYAYHLDFTDAYETPNANRRRITGLSVRCIAQ